MTNLVCLWVEVDMLVLFPIRNCINEVREQFFLPNMIQYSDNSTLLIYILTLRLHPTNVKLNM